jgi:hypothetical protein
VHLHFEPFLIFSAMNVSPWALGLIIAGVVVID